MAGEGLQSPALMEELWRDLSRNEDDLASPEWHGAVLAERERRLASGEDKLIDWKIAKRELLPSCAATRRGSRGV